jgi:hypothetical protein
VNDPARRTAVGLFVLTFVTYAWFFGGGGWNQNAHFDLTRALVERQTFHIDGYRVNTGDISWSPVSGQWHAYSNKPPGLPLLAAIPYAAISSVERAMHRSLDDWFVMTLNMYLLTVIVCATAGAGIAVLTFRWARRMDAPPGLAVLTAIAGAFGTIVLPYSTVFFSPVPAAFFLLLAFVLLDERPVLAGAAAGVAGMCYYLCIPAAAILAAGVFVRSRPKAMRFVAAGLPFGVILAIYHTVCFGAPWRTSLTFAQNFTEGELLLGLFRNYPTKVALWGLTFSEYRGLFFVSPVLLLACVGAGVMIRRPALRRDVVMIAAIALMMLVLMASFSGWEGGGSFGPRHLLPALPLLVLPLAFLRGRALVALTLALTLVSVAVNLVATAVDVSPAGGIRRPLRDFYLPVFRTGRIPDETLAVMGATDAEVGKVSVNRQAVDELTPHRVRPRGSHESEWASFNLGEFLFGAGSRTSVLPIVLWMVGGSVLLATRATAAVRPVS